MVSIDGTTPMNRPPGFKLARIDLQRAVDQANVGHDKRIDGHGDIELAGKIVEVMHRPLEECHPGRGFGIRACPRRA